mmetsp:Transcript_2552/g.6224  ORF Transcript_2552/g.6224 Transcript_2552/m.6224 type:complete len:207 (+) Transcript_2552:42-662(+)
MSKRWRTMQTPAASPPCRVQQPPRHVGHVGPGGGSGGPAGLRLRPPREAGVSLSPALGPSVGRGQVRQRGGPGGSEQGAARAAEQGPCLGGCEANIAAPCTPVSALACVVASLCHVQKMAHNANARRKPSLQSAAAAAARGARRTGRRQRRPRRAAPPSPPGSGGFAFSRARPVSGPGSGPAARGPGRQRAGSGAGGRAGAVPGWL